MVILGIDPGFGRMGYAILEKKQNQEKLLEYSCISTDSKSKYEDRILQIGQQIEKLIKKHQPDILAIEKLFFNTNQKTAFKVSEARGVVIYLALKNGLKLKEYTPLEAKMAVCGYGKASKDQVNKMVNMLIKIKEQPKYDDTMDAIALCLTCSAKSKFS